MDTKKKQKNNIPFRAYCCGKPMLKEQRGDYVYFRCANPNHGRWFAVAIDASEQSYCSCDWGRSPLITKDFGDFRLYGGCQYCGARYSVYKEGVEIVFEVQGSNANEVKKVSAKGMASIWDHLGGPWPHTDAKSIFSKQHLADMIKGIRPDITVKVGEISGSGDVIKPSVEAERFERRDIFICHASKDKKDYVHPLLEALRARGITYWIDEAEIRWGDKITKKINEGLTVSRYVVVLLTQSFLDRNWPQAELESALHLETSTGEVVVLPLLVAPQELVFKQYPLLRDKLYLRWEEGLDAIVTRLAELLGREFKNEWVYCHPATYAGKVWIRVVTKPENHQISHEYVIRWGPREYKGKLLFGGRQCLSLVHAKGDDGLSVPIFFTISLACYVSFGQGEPLDEHAIDVNYGWSRVE